MEKAYLILADGTIFEGKPFGARAGAEGPVVFATNMTGFEESLTDGAHAGEILCQTFPLVGAPGFNSTDAGPGPLPAAYVVRDWCAHPSGFRSEMDLDAFLKKKGVPGLCGIDTRALTRHLRRSGGAMAGVLQTDPPAGL